MTNFSRTANGKYVVHSKSYDVLKGTRAQVWHGTAYKTSGSLTRSDLLKNRAGRIVSKAKHHTAKKDMRLVKAGYGTKKGKFGFVKIGKKSKSKRGGNNVRHSTHHNVTHNNNMKHNVSHSMGHHSTQNNRGQKGGSSLSPSSYNGTGVKTSGVGVQFLAGNASS